MSDPKNMTKPISIFKLLIVGLPLLILATTTAVWLWGVGLWWGTLLVAIGIILLTGSLLYASQRLDQANNTAVRNQERLEQLTHLLTATTDFVGISTADGHILYLNKAARELLTLNPDTDITQLKTELFYPPESLTRLRTQILPTVNETGIWQGETMFQSPAGQTFYVSQVIIGYRLPDGSVG